MKIAICGKIFCKYKKVSKNLKNIFNLKIYSLIEKATKLSMEIFNMKYKNNNLINNIYGKMRNIDKTIWVNYLLNKIENNNVLITNVKFPEEAKLLKDNGFLIIKINIDINKQKDFFRKKYNYLNLDLLKKYNKYYDIDNIKEDFSINYNDSVYKIIDFINKKNNLIMV